MSCLHLGDVLISVTAREAFHVALIDHFSQQNIPIAIAMSMGRHLEPTRLFIEAAGSLTKPRPARAQQNGPVG